jgi:hypothetical protein
MKRDYIHRDDFDRREERVAEVGENGNRGRAAGTSTKRRTGIMLVVMTGIRLRGCGRQNHSYPRLPGREQPFICTGPEGQAQEIDRQQEGQPLHSNKGTLKTYATGSQKGNRITRF